MPRQILIAALLLWAATVQAEWKRIAPGVDYQEFATSPTQNYRVARIDLGRPGLKVVSSRPSDKGTTISRFADKHDAIVAINGDYFDEKLRPVGITLGPCGEWSERAASVKRKQPTVVFGGRRGEIVDPSSTLPSWGEQAVSGWPVLVRSCRALTSKELPGSDAFTRSPHPRTAVGFSRDQKTAYFVVVNGTKENRGGVTLAALASFFTDTLGACSAINLDGGGSSAMAVNEKLVSTPVYGKERPVANHLAVIDSSTFKDCDASESTRTLRATDVWKDVDEILGVTGKTSNGSYSATFLHDASEITFAGSAIAPALARSSSLYISRSGDTTRAVGVIAAANGQASLVEEELEKEGFSSRSVDIDGVSPALKHVVFSKSGDATSLAHAFRRALDRAGARQERVNGAPSFSTSGVASALGRSGAYSGGAWLTELTRGKGRAAWHPKVSTYDALNGVAIGDSGSSQFAIGRVVIAAAGRERLEQRFEDLGFATNATLMPGASSTSIIYFWKRGGARQLAEEIREALR